MNSYENATRGIYQNKEFARQIISFEGMRFKGRTGLMNVTPTDIDGAIHLANENAVILYELKHGDPKLPAGQEDALTSIIDFLIKGGANAVLFVATHDTENNEEVIAADSIVKRFYTDSKWWYAKKDHTLNEWIKASIGCFNEGRKLYE